MRTFRWWQRREPVEPATPKLRRHQPTNISCTVDHGAGEPCCVQCERCKMFLRPNEVDRECHAL